MGLAVAVAFTWWSYRYESQRITASTFGFRVLGDASTEVTFEVTRPSGMAVTCTVQALSFSFAVVGSADFPVPTGGEPVIRLTRTVRTASPAVAGRVSDCVRA